MGIEVYVSAVVSSPVSVAVVSSSVFTDVGVTAGGGVSVG
jgi:hypothetical protein